MKFKTQFRLRVDSNRQRAIGPGKVALLEAIIATGSISAAARKLRMSYRRAWLLIDDLNHQLHSPAVSRVKGGKKGGGSDVTATGKKLVRLYRDIEHRAYATTLPGIRALTRLLEK